MLACSRMVDNFGPRCITESLHAQSLDKLLLHLNLDDIPFIGSFSGLDGLTLAPGSWYGFALAPAIGSSVADHLAGLPTPELDQLSPDRIARFDPEQVAAFMTEPAISNVVE
jgi:hypothetical protein